MWTFKVSESALDDHVLQLIFISCNTMCFTMRGYIYHQTQRTFSQSLLVSGRRVSTLHGHHRCLVCVYVYIGPI